MEILLHENIGGGFSPPAATKISRLGRKARSGLDRKPYKGHRPVSFVSYHTRAISMGIVKADAYTVFYASISAKAKLCRLQKLRGNKPSELVRQCSRKDRDFDGFTLVERSVGGDKAGPGGGSTAPATAANAVRV